MARRDEAKAETRARIVAAAAAIYRERGMSGASNLALARAADVAPATVRNHFPDPQSLAEAVFDLVLAELRPPGPEIFDGIVGLAGRVRRLSQELHAFFDRSEGWWGVYQGDPALTAAWSAGAERYERGLDDLMRVALGPELAGDGTAVAVLASVVGPPLFFTLQGRGLSSEQAKELGIELVVPWLEARARRRSRAAR